MRSRHLWISTLATLGVLMAPLPMALVAGTLAAAAGFGVALAAVKIAVFKRLRIA